MEAPFEARRYVADINKLKRRAVSRRAVRAKRRLFDLLAQTIDSKSDRVQKDSYLFKGSVDY